MISFRHRNQTKRIQLKQPITEERLTKWLAQILNTKGTIIGFKTPTGDYYDAEYFVRHKERFYGEVVDVIEASDQLEMSFTSDNLSTSFVQQPTNTGRNNGQQKSTTSEISNLGYVHDLRNLDKVLMNDPQGLSMIFIIEEQPNKTSQLLSRLNLMANRHQEVALYYHLLTTRVKFSCSVPLFLVYMGKKKVAEIAIRSNLENIIDAVVLRWSQFHTSQPVAVKSKEHDDDDCPSFVANDVVEQAHRQRLEESFEATQRPITRQEQRRSNLKKSVSDIETVKIENFLEILESLPDLIAQDEYHVIKGLLIEENEEVMNYFNGFLSRQYDRITLANNLVIIAANSRSTARPISRCIPRNVRGNRQTVRDSPTIVPQNTQGMSMIAQAGSRKSEKKTDQQHKLLDYNALQQGLIKLEGVPQFGQSRKPSLIGRESREDIDSPCPSPQQPPKNTISQNNYSPLKILQQQSLQLSYKAAERVVLLKGEEMAPEECGLMLHLLRNHEQTICHIVQQIEKAPDSPATLDQIRQAMGNRLDIIFRAEFSTREIQDIVREKQVVGSVANCAYQNFRYEADLEVFLNELKKQLKQEEPKMNKKKSLPSLTNLESIHHVDKAVTNRSKGSPSFDEQSFDSKDSAQKMEDMKQQELQNFYKTRYWDREFSELLQCVKMTEKTKQKLKNLFEMEAPSLFLILRQYNLSKVHNTLFDKNSIKKYLRKQDKPTECQRLAKYAAFKYFLVALQNEGKIDEDKNHWMRLQFIDESPAVISAFQSYLHSKDEQEFLQNIDYLIKMKNQNDNKIGLETFTNRIVFFLSRIYEHPNVLRWSLQRFNNVFRGVCQIYHQNADSIELFENIDLLNEYGFEKRMAEEIERCHLIEEEKKIVMEDFNRQQQELIEEILNIFEKEGDLRPFLLQYAEHAIQEQRQKKLSAIEENNSEDRLERESFLWPKQQIENFLKTQNRQDLIELLKERPDQDNKLRSLWSVHEIGLHDHSEHNDRQFLESLEILLSSQVEEKIQSFMSRMNQLNLTPIIKRKIQSKDPKLMKIIRKYSAGSPSSAIKDDLRHYEQQELPQIVNQILKSVGLSPKQIDKAMHSNEQEVKTAVANYIENNQKEDLLELLQRAVEEDDKKQ